MRRPADLRRLRAAVVVFAVLLLSLHWSIREDPCARPTTLEIVVVNQLQGPADVTLVVTDAAGTAVYAGTFHIDAGGSATTGQVVVPPGTYHAEASVGGDGWGMETLRVGPCGQQARVSVTPESVTIVRSEGP